MAAPNSYLPPPQAQQQSAYPTASYTPILNSPPRYSSAVDAPAPASYIAPPSYRNDMYVSEGNPYVSRSYGAPFGPATTSYTPAPVSYVAPPNMVGASASFAPEIVPGSPLPTTTTTTYLGSPSKQLSSPMPMVQSAGSYVAAPGGPPPKLTEGMPDPGSVESQKQAYSKKIEASLRHETSLLAQRNQAQKQSLAQMVQSQKAQYNLQMDQYLQQQAMAVDQQANAEMMMLQEAATAQKMALEQQAAGLTLEYQQRKAQEEMMAREYQIQKQYYDAEQKLAQQYQSQLSSLQPQQPPSAPQQLQPPPWAMSTGNLPMQTTGFSVQPPTSMYSPQQVPPVTTTTYMPPQPVSAPAYGMAGGFVY